MSDMDSNAQYGNAAWIADRAENEVQAMSGNAFATLAVAEELRAAAESLAYEQRTANLIAVFGGGGGTDLHIKVRAQILERLGLGDA